MAWAFPYILFLHVFGAILAFGPTYAYSIIGAMSRREPQHGNFALRTTARIGSALVYPLAVLQGVTGFALIAIGGITIMDKAWLMLSIILYLIALVFALTVQRAALHRAIELSSAPPPAGAPPGPPPGMAETLRKIQMGGIFLAVVVAVIVFLMVVKPTI